MPNYPKRLQCGLKYIGGFLYIHSNQNLTNFAGLQALNSIGGDLSIGGRTMTMLVGNPSLVSFTGLNSLSGIGGALNILGNENLPDFSGLDNLSYIGGEFNVHDNASLASFSGIEQMEQLDEHLLIRNNPSLSSLSGLENIAIGGYILVTGNGNLTDCQAQGICNYLSDPSASVNIYNNAPGCNNPAEVADACGISLSCLPYGNYYLLSQTDIDQFTSNYLGCTDLQGSVLIKGDDIASLNGLNSG